MKTYSIIYSTLAEDLQSNMASENKAKKERKRPPPLSVSSDQSDSQIGKGDRFVPTEKKMSSSPIVFMPPNFSTVIIFASTQSVLFIKSSSLIEYPFLKPARH